MIKKSKKTSKSTDNNLIPLLLGFSVVTTLFFLYRIFVLVQDLRQDIQGAPNSYAFWPALAAALYVYSSTKEYRYKHIAIVLVTTLVVGMLVWLFGVTKLVDLRTIY